MPKLFTAVFVALLLVQLTYRAASLRCIKKPIHSHTRHFYSPNKEIEKTSGFEIPSLTQTLTSIATAAALLGFSLPVTADVGSSAILPLKINDRPSILRTTTQELYADSKSDNNNYLKTFFETSQNRVGSTGPSRIEESIDFNAIKNGIFSFPENSNFLLFLFGWFIVTNDSESKRDLVSLAEDTANEIIALNVTNTKTLELIQEERDMFTTLQGESKKLLEQVESLSQQLTDKSVEMNTLIVSIEELKQSASEAPDGMDIVNSLKEDVADWKDQLLALKQVQSDMLSKARKETDEAPALILRKQQEDEMLTALQTFVTKLNLLPEKVTNMMQMSVAPGLLDDISAIPAPEVPAPIAPPPVPDTALEDKATALAMTLQILTEDNVKLNSDIKSLTAKRSATEAANKLAQEVADKAAKEAAKEVADKAAKEAAKEAADKAAKKAVVAVDNKDNDSMTAAVKENKALKADVAKSQKTLAKLESEMNSKLEAATAMTYAISTRLSEKEDSNAETGLMASLKESEKTKKALQQQLDVVRAQVDALKDKIQLDTADKESVVDKSESNEKQPVEEKRVDQKSTKPTLAGTRKKSKTAKVAAESKIKKTDWAVDKDAALLQLRDMKTYQVKAMTKNTLVKTLAVLGVTENTANMKKNELLDLLANAMA